MESDFRFAVKTLSEAGQFSGMAAVYGNLDLGGDRIMPGAFTETLAERGSEIPVLWAHDMAAPVGLGTLSDSSEGLRIVCQLDLDVKAGQEAMSRVKKRIVKGLSIGYNIPAGGATIVDGVRQLTKLDLYEVSLVAVPMNPRATITAAKSITSTREFEAWLREKGGYTKAEAAAIAGRGFRAARDERDPAADLREDLAAWLEKQARG